MKSPDRRKNGPFGETEFERTAKYVFNEIHSYPSGIRHTVETMVSDPIDALLVDEEAHVTAHAHEDLDVREACQVTFRTIWICLICFCIDQILNLAVAHRIWALGYSFSECLEGFLLKGILYALPFGVVALLAFLCRRVKDLAYLLLVFAALSALRAVLLWLSIIIRYVITYSIPPPDGIMHRDGVFSYLETIIGWIWYIDTFLVLPLYWLLLGILFLGVLIALGVSKWKRRRPIK